MSHLVLLVHADPAVRQRYVDALPKSARLVIVNKPADLPGLSSAYMKLALQLKDSATGRILPALVQKYAPGTWQTVSLITFSAGYGLARELMRSPADRAQLAGYVAIDSIHASITGGDVHGPHIAGFSKFAARAKQSTAVFAIGHSDVKTHGYASTTQTAAAIERAAGGAGGLFTVNAYDVRPASQQRQEHAAALLEWGPKLVRETLGEHLSQIQTKRPSLKGRSDSFVFELLRQATRDLEDEIREDLGRNDGHRIREYFRRFGMSGPGNWCAVSCSTWIQDAADAVGIDPPIPGSPGAQAMMAQIKAAKNCQWLEPFELNRTNAPGALVVWQRGRPGSWMGHVGIVTQFDGKRWFQTIEGNSGPAGDRVAVMERAIDDPRLFGFGLWPEEPQSDPDPQAVSENLTPAPPSAEPTERAPEPQPEAERETLPSVVELHPRPSLLGAILSAFVSVLRRFFSRK